MADGWTEEAKAAAEFLARRPKYGMYALKRVDLQSLMLQTTGTLIVQGYLYNIKAKPIGGGISRVTLERMTP